MLRCKKCNFECPAKAAYCQNCGQKTRGSGFRWSDAKSLAGMGQKGISIAPLVCDVIEGQANASRRTPARPVPAPLVQPVAERFFCPTCGEPATRGTAFCKGCGREFG